LSHLGWFIFSSGDFSLFTEAEIEEKELHNICLKKEDAKRSGASECDKQRQLKQCCI